MNIPKPYFKNLDGLRAFAAISVVFYHVCNWIPSTKVAWVVYLKHLISFNGMGGVYGVFFFFILSGFLITYFLLHDIHEQGRVKLVNFYFRRALRIWPLYFITLIAGFVLYPMYKNLQGEPYIENASILMYSTFLANYDNIFSGNPTSSILGVQWSVAVEEQFYLFWPLLFMWRIKPGFLITIFITIILFSDLFHFQQTTWSSKHYHFFSCIRFLATGGLIAVISYFYKNMVKRMFDLIPMAGIVVIYVLSLGFLFYGDDLIGKFNPLKYLIHVLPFLFFSFVILEQNVSTKSFVKFGSSKFLCWLGGISYGIYLLHMIVVVFIKEISWLNGPDMFILNLILVSIFTVIISHYSFKYLETFFLRFKQKFPA